MPTSARALLDSAFALETPELAVPHPRFRERLFVLEPLSEIAPDWIDPVTGQTVVQLTAALKDRPT